MTARVGVFDGGLQRPAQPGDTIISPVPLEIATDAAVLLTVEQIARRFIQFTSFSAGRAVTTPTAALLLASSLMSDLNIGESITIVVSCIAAFAATWTAGVGVTLAGRATTPASSWSYITIRKLSATTVEWRVS